MSQSDRKPPSLLWGVGDGVAILETTLGVPGSQLLHDPAVHSLSVHQRDTCARVCGNTAHNSQKVVNPSADGEIKCGPPMQWAIIHQPKRTQRCHS